MSLLGMTSVLLLAEEAANPSQDKAVEVVQKKTDDPASVPKIGEGVRLLATLTLPQRGALLRQLEGKPLTLADIRQFALNFTTLPEDVRQSEDVAEYLTLVFEVAHKRGLLDAKMATTFGRLFVGDSFNPEGNGFGKNSRGFFEKCRTMASPELRQSLEDGVRECFEEQLAKTPNVSPSESIRKLVRAMTNWGDEQYARSADCFFGSEYASSWNLAVKHLGVLFLLKSREVSPEAKTLSNQMVANWLNDLAQGKALTPIKPSEPSAEDKVVLNAALIEIGAPDILKRMTERSWLPENRHVGGVVGSPPIIYAHQFRNLILKEIRRGFPLDEKQIVLVDTELNKNEAELTDMLKDYLAEEETTDGLSGYNTYAIATTVLTTRDPSLALKAMRDVSDQEYSPYYVDSNFRSTPRAGAGRTVPFRLAEMVHGRTPAEIKTARERLAKAAVNYMDHLPDLMYHARGRYWHRGEDRIAPYFFHPTVPYEAGTLRMLTEDPEFSEMERTHFKYLKDRLRRAIIASQKADGTFMLPDTVGDPTEKKEENGGYYSSASWVNPLAGLALLCLIDEAKEPQTQYGILNPESFQRK